MIYIKKNIKSIYIIIILICLVSCQKSNDNKQLSIALDRAKDNRQELEQVLDHYKNTDSLKYKAARFLIQNMPGHYSYCGEQITLYNKKIDSVLNRTQKDGRYHDTPYLAQLIDSISEAHKRISFPVQEDIRIMKADFLIRNIEQAFDLWQNKPWAQHLSFDDFCEYLLPYQIGQMDVLEDWRAHIYEQIDSCTLAELGDFRYSSEMRNSAFWACKHINSYLDRKLVPKNSVFIIPFQAKTSIRSKISFGSCHEFTQAALATMRSLGIPVMIDFTPQWPYRSMKHIWNVLLANNGKNLPFGGCDIETDPDRLHKPEQKMAKVYRKTYAMNQDIVRLIETEQYVPELFRNIFMKDVTNEYMKTYDITIPIQWKQNHKYAYLAVFDNQKWVPVCYGEQDGRGCKFKDIGNDIVYLPMYYDEQGIHPLNVPFILDLQGNAKYLQPNLNARQKAILDRKYFLSKSMFDYAKCLVGGRFEASNTPDFNPADSIYTITDWSLTQDSISIEHHKAYRYWRYISAQNQACNMTELSFFSQNGEEQNGIVIGTDSSVRYDIIQMDKYKVFDKDPLTYYEAPITLDYPWVGLDFGKSIAINKILYTPRNDDNNISIGDLYELFYWDENHWMSLGEKIADKRELIYTNVPDNALLLLKNFTKGKEERIFTYEDGRQVWW